jgi:hypothetical protein
MSREQVLIDPNLEAGGYTIIVFPRQQSVETLDEIETAVLNWLESIGS